MTKYGRQILKKEQDRMTAKEPFNKEMIDFRSHDDIEYLVSNICKGLEIVDGVKFVSCSVEKFDHVYEEKKEVKTDKRRSVKSPYPPVSTVQSRFVLIKLKMKYEDLRDPETRDKDETCVEEYEFYYPELVNNQYFYLNGNRFFPVYQLVDSEFYKTAAGSIVLKTMFMPINISGFKGTLNDLNKELKTPSGNKGIKARVFQMNLFKKKINMMEYFFAKFGVTGTIEFFGFSDYISIISSTDPEDDNYLYFKMTTSLKIKVSKEWFDFDKSYHPSFVITFTNAFRNRKMDANYDNLDYWMRQLGKHFTKNNSRKYDKAYSIILSLERLIDKVTYDNLRFPDEEKENVYTIIRFMVRNFDAVSRIDNYDLANKRLRISEYILYPFINRLSNTVYRLVGMQSPSVYKRKQLFSSISKDFIIGKLSGQELIRYSNNVNTLDLFTRLCKGSKSGPQSMASGGSAPLSLRSIDESYVGRLDLTTTSSNDPGIAFTVSPFLERHDPNGTGNFFFTDAPNLTLVTEDGEIFGNDDYDLEIDVDEIMEEDE
jgi:hypothetical protein